MQKVKIYVSKYAVCCMSCVQSKLICIWNILKCHLSPTKNSKTWDWKLDTIVTTHGCSCIGGCHMATADLLALKVRKLNHLGQCHTNLLGELGPAVGTRTHWWSRSWCGSQWRCPREISGEVSRSSNQNEFIASSKSYNATTLIALWRSCGHTTSSLSLVFGEVWPSNPWNP